MRFPVVAENFATKAENDVFTAVGSVFFRSATGLTEIFFATVIPIIIVTGGNRHLYLILYARITLAKHKVTPLAKTTGNVCVTMP